MEIIMAISDYNMYTISKDILWILSTKWQCVSTDHLYTIFEA